MRRNDLHGMQRINRFVDWKLEQLEKSDKTFRSLYGLMFFEPDNVMMEYSVGRKQKELTYGEVKAKIEKMAAKLSLRTADIPKNSMIGLYMDNSPEWIECFWAILHAGYRPLLMNLRLEAERIEEVIRENALPMIISDGKILSAPTVLADELLGDCDAPIPEDWADEVLVMSSGTSATVKLCAYSGLSFYYQILDSADIIRCCRQIKKHYHGKLKHLTFLPFYHIFGLAAMYIWFSFFSRSFVFLADAGADTLLRTIKNREVTHIFSVPLFWTRIYEAAMRKIHGKGEKTEKKFKKGLAISTALSGVPFLQRLFAKLAFKEVRDNLFGESIRFLISGGSAVPKEVLEFFNGIGYHLTEGYGMSEVGITSVELSNSPKKRNTGSVGRPLSSIRYQISEDGELMIAGRSTAVAIIRHGVRAERDPEEFFPTRDLAECKKGCYYILGRKDDMIPSSSGENLNPEVIEREVLTEGIREACLIREKTEQGVSPVLLLEVNRYQSADKTRALFDEVRAKLTALGLSGELNKTVMTHTPLIAGDDFKLNRRKIADRWAAGLIAPINLEEELGEEEEDELTVALKELFAEALGKEIGDIGVSDHFYFDLGGSSLDYLALMCAVKDKFEVEFSEDSAGNLISVGAFRAYLEKCL